MGDASGGHLSDSPFGGGTSSGAGSTAPAGGGTPYGGTAETCPLRETPPPPRPPVHVRVSLYFDGTGNNRVNVGLGPEHNSDDSYAAGLSNVAKLESAGLDRPGPGVDRHFTVYTEGIGTTNRGDDSSVDMGLGTGSTGVPAKVAAGLRSAVSLIHAFADGRTIATVQIDTFGFSRGAAAARHCVWWALNQPRHTLRDWLERRGNTVGTVQVKFVGLYDTVASYGVNHDDDTADLRLNAISVAEKVVQLAAAEEHRKNFRLTNIRSAGANGRQIFLPGVHSDVGGGYADSEDEVDLQLLDLDVAWVGDAERAALQRERNWLVAAGWYRASELQDTSFFNEVKATRRGITNTYSRIPLKILADFARENGVAVGATLEDEHPVPPALATANTEIMGYVNSCRSSAPGDWFSASPGGDPAWHKALRHDHLHFSSYYGSTAYANEPQWSTDDPVTGRRRRIIQNG